MSVVKDAYENARFLCDQYYLASPDLIINETQHKRTFGRVHLINWFQCMFFIYRVRRRGVHKHSLRAVAFVSHVIRIVQELDESCNGVPRFAGLLSSHHRDDCQRQGGHMFEGIDCLLALKMDLIIFYLPHCCVCTHWHRDCSCSSKYLTLHQLVFVHFPAYELVSLICLCLDET